ncbi:MAG TPA: hypothetical protein VFV37_06270 [Luteibaculaceae bacterium]|nr:hypothetical protein [Luteibaculaceae bacterium]
MKTLAGSLLLWLWCSSVYGQATLLPGDIAFVAFKAGGSVDSVSFVVLKKPSLPSGTVLQFTDNGIVYRSEGALFRTGEGIVKWTAQRDYSFGEVVTIYTGSLTAIGASSGVCERVSGTLSLASSGDQIFAFLGTWPNPTHLIAGLNYTTSSKTTDFFWNTDTSGSAFSARPVSGVINNNQLNLGQFRSVWVRKIAGSQQSGVRAGRWKGVSDPNLFSGSPDGLRNSINTPQNWADFQTGTGDVPSWSMPASLAVPALAVDFQYQAPTCADALNGRILAIARGGGGEYKYRWLHNDSQGPSLEFASVGTYALEVSDQLGNWLRADAMLTGPAPIELISQVIPPCGTHTLGAAILEVDGGSPPYQILWSDGATAWERHNLEAGIYTVSVQDSSRCKTQVQLNVDAAVSQAFPGPDTLWFCPGTQVSLNQLVPSYRSVSADHWLAVEHASTRIALISESSTCADTGFVTLNALAVAKPQVPDTAVACLSAPTIPVDHFSPPSGSCTWLDRPSEAMPAQAGLYSFRYQALDPGSQCVSFRDFTLHLIDDTPPTLMPPTSICLNATSVPLPEQDGVSWYKDTAGFAISAVVPMDWGSGLHPLWLKYRVGQCIQLRSFSIGVLDTPMVDLRIPAQWCTDDEPQELSGGWPLGGIYTVDHLPTNTITPRWPGYYSVGYAITDQNGCTSALHREIQVLPSHRLQLEISQSSICPGNQAVLRSPDPGVLYHNSIAIEAFESLEMPVTTGGIYYALPKNQSLCEVGSDTVSLTVFPTETNKIEFQGLLCSDTRAMLRSANGIPGQWYLDGIGVAYDSVLEARHAGWYRVETINEWGCRVVSDSLYIHPEVDVQLNASATRFCAGDSVNLSVGQGSQFELYLNGEKIDQSALGHWRVTQPGFYHVWVTDEQGCRGQTNSLLLQRVPRPAPQIHVTGETVMCSGHYNKLSTANYRFIEWFRNGESMNLHARNWLNYGEGVFTVLVQDSNGCKAVSESVAVQLVEMNQPELAVVDDREYCLGDTAYLMASEHPGAIYEWYKDQQLYAHNTLSTLGIQEAGTYEVQVRIGGCVKSSNPVVVRFKSDALAPKIALQDTLLVANLEDSLWWYYNGLPYCQRPANAPLMGSGYYQAKLEDKSGCLLASNVVVVGGTGLQETRTADLRALAYPNPFDREIHLPAGVAFKLVRADGSLVMQGISSGILVTSDLVSGWYVLTWVDETTFVTVPMVKR